MKIHWRGKILVDRKAHPRKSYVRKGKRVPPAHVKRAIFLAQDRGAPGRTPKSKRFYPGEKPENIPTGWRKDLSTEGRRRALSQADKKFGSIKVFHDLLGTANVTTDKPTERKMRQDLKWFGKTKLNATERRKMTSKARAARQV